MIVATICARGGSKGVPGKNKRLLCGLPLIVHSINQAQAVPEIDEVYVSTDDPEIAEIACKAGANVPFIRPASLASDTAGKLEVVKHLVGVISKDVRRPNIVVDLDPTSPLRSIDDIKSCIELLDEDTSAVITVCPSDKNPYFNMVEFDASGHAHMSKQLETPVLSRQKAPDVYSMNASIYVYHGENIVLDMYGGRIRAHIMPRERSVDIDDMLDFKIVSMLMDEAHHAKIK